MIKSGDMIKESRVHYQAELWKEGILFCTQFPSLGIFIDKRVGFRKNKDYLVYNF